MRSAHFRFSITVISSEHLVIAKLEGWPDIKMRWGNTIYIWLLSSPSNLDGAWNIICWFHSTSKKPTDYPLTWQRTHTSLLQRETLWVFRLSKPGGLTRHADKEEQNLADVVEEVRLINQFCVIWLLLAPSTPSSKWSILETCSCPCVSVAHKTTPARAIIFSVL